MSLMTSLLVGMTLAINQAEPTAQAVPQDSKPATPSPATRENAPPGDSSSTEPQNQETKEPKSGENGFVDFIKPKREDGGFPFRLYKAYYDEFFPTKSNCE